MAAASAVPGEIRPLLLFNLRRLLADQCLTCVRDVRQLSRTRFLLILDLLDDDPAQSLDVTDCLAGALWQSVDTELRC
jgi:hypothetical protein